MPAARGGPVSDGAGSLLIRPEPSEEERRVIVAALEPNVVQPPALLSAWRRSGLEFAGEGFELGNDAPAQQPRRHSGVVEP